MELKHAVMVGMLSRVADRFHEYHPPLDLQTRLDLASQVAGVDGIEIVYPNDFPVISETIRLVRDSGLPVAAINLNVKSQKKWERGSFTATDPRLRAEAVEDLKVAMDLAAELGSVLVSCCPLIDGHNYNFEVDYLDQWGWLVEGIACGAAYRNDVRLSLEYKLNESRNYNLLSDVGRTLYLCECVGRPNLGVTVDVGHALLAKETPAEALSLAALANRLFYVHFNDNGREWDWDMLPGSVNFWDMMEVLFYLDRLDWQGWLSYDVVVRSDELVEAMSASIRILETAKKLLDKFGRTRLEKLITAGLPGRTFQTLLEALL